MGALGVLVGSYCSSSYGAANTFIYLGPFSSSSIGDPVFSPMVGWQQPPLYMSGTGRSSQETAISASCQHSLVGIHNRVWIWRLYVVIYPQVGETMDGLSFTLCYILHGCVSLHWYFVPASKNDQSSILWSSFFLSFMWSVNWILGIPRFWVNTHLSVSA